MTHADPHRGLVLATNNAGKLWEIAALLAPLGLTVTPQGALGIPEAEETGLTFVENAILKARHAAAASGQPAIADDSGLAVDALGGAPGIWSARYASREAAAAGVASDAGLAGDRDTANCARLLAALEGVPPPARTARFHCLMVYLRHAADPTPIICEGTWEGRILPAPRGDNGFGYDPVFLVPEHGCSAAELDAATKNRLSHRGAALRALIARLPRPHGGAAP